MIRRCHNTKSKSYKYYGGQGIMVCERWRKSYALFVDDMGLRPNKLHSIDRIDTTKNYEPGNCRWTTKLVQMNNMKSNRFVLYKGERMTVADAYKASGSAIKYQTYRARIERGVDVHDALTRPLQSGIALHWMG
jgi:hypothetical protein